MISVAVLVIRQMYHVMGRRVRIAIYVVVV